MNSVGEKKVGVVGLGPVGMILAVHLKEAGLKVAICDIDKVKINLIRREGIRIEGIMQKRHFFDHVFSGINEMTSFQPDIVFVSVKSYHTPSSVEEMAHLKNINTVFISAQNGIDTEQMISALFGKSQTMRMVINYAGNLNAPNVVKTNFFTPPNYLASSDDSKIALAKEISGWLNGVKLQTEAISASELTKKIWEKTILNASLSPLCAIGKLTIKEAMDIPDSYEIIEQVIEEAVEVATAEKIIFEDGFVRKCLLYLKKAGDHFPSLAVDLMNNRPTEIDFMNGKIMEYGRKHFLRTPLNLVLTNTVKAMGQKNTLSALKSLDGNLLEKIKKSQQLSKENGYHQPAGEADPAKGNYFLGVDLGSAYTKFTVINEEEQIVFQSALKTLNRDKIAVRHVMNAINSEYPLKASCATGYGRKHFPDANSVKTEINCAAAGVSKYFRGAKNIIDIGGEDIKVIKCNADDNIENFYLNDKCAAGTGSFIVEVAERADISIAEMSHLASKSNFKNELNSFCTVFAKTEIMQWMFDGLPVEDVARGIYISIVNRVGKLRIETSLPVYLIGGVVSFHPYLSKLFTGKFKKECEIIERPQFVSSLGAALFAKKNFLSPKCLEINR
ncbi:MAG: 2-dehydropantoate 2-reductase [Bacteroidetes bacterium]|nr:2-dehydropantoate 2-reductase [Bacteroidota bacterium]